MTARSARARAIVALAATLAGCTALPAAAGAAEPRWRLEQPPPPAGVEHPVALGYPTDLQFVAPDRGLLAVRGNGAEPAGLFVYDGTGWQRLSTVCGGAEGRTRIAWAGPREFWTIADTAAGQPAFTASVTLCRFRDGAVVASYAAPEASPDPHHPMLAAACRAADDCWFAGALARTPDGARGGTFHLHWDGAELRTVYLPHGRAVADLAAHGGELFEAALVGPLPDSELAAEPRPAQERPLLLQRLRLGNWSPDPFVTAPSADWPEDATELLALDGDGRRLWAVGGKATSGPSRGYGYYRPPLAVTIAAGGEIAEVPLALDAFAGNDRLVDVAAVPGADAALAAVFPESPLIAPGQRHARLARIALDGAVTIDQVPAGGEPPRGDAVRVACPAPDDCWMVTYTGWIYHLTDGAPRPRDPDPPFVPPISYRPPDARTPQRVPDNLPFEDIPKYELPPVVEAPAPVEAATATRRRAAYRITRVRSRLRGRRTLIVSFTVRGRVRIGLEARRGGRVIARARVRTLRSGRHALHLRLDPRRWPSKLRFVIR